MKVYSISFRDPNPYTVLGHKSAGFIHAKSIEDAAYIVAQLAMFSEIVCLEPASALVSFVAMTKARAHGKREGLWRGDTFTPFNMRNSKLDKLLAEK